MYACMLIYRSIKYKFCVSICLSSIGGQTAGPIMTKFGTHMQIDLGHRWNQTPTWKTIQGTHKPDHSNRCWWPLQCHRTLGFTWQHQSANHRSQKEKSRKLYTSRKTPDRWTVNRDTSCLSIYHQLLAGQFPRNKNHVTKASSWEVETSWSFKKHDQKWVKNSHFNSIQLFL